MEDEAEDAEWMVGLSLVEATGDVGRSWFFWSHGEQNLLGISLESVEERK